MIGYPPFVLWVTVNCSLMIDSWPSDTTPGFVPGAGTSESEHAHRQANRDLQADLTDHFLYPG